MVDWFKKPNKILDKSHENKGFWRWFSDGELNICYNCVDRHKELGAKPALHWVSNMLNISKTYSWVELLDNVSRLGAVF
jgi:propionyl-CoA synthetase